MRAPGGRVTLSCLPRGTSPPRRLQPCRAGHHHLRLPHVACLASQLRRAVAGVAAAALAAPGRGFGRPRQCHVAAAVPVATAHLYLHPRLTSGPTRPP